MERRGESAMGVDPAETVGGVEKRRRRRRERGEKRRDEATEEERASAQGRKKGEAVALTLFDCVAGRGEAEDESRARDLRLDRFLSARSLSAASISNKRILSLRTLQTSGK